MKPHAPHCLLFLCLLFASSFSSAATIQIGDLLISEVLANPAAVSDSNGEFFELFNTSNTAIDINGFTLSDNGSNTHVIASANSLLIQPGEYFVLGNNGDTNSNGGYIADYVYSDFSLTNNNDEIIITTPDNFEVVRLEYSTAPFGSTGISAELINQVLQPSQDDYALSTPIFGDGDLGTPGQAGSVLLTAAIPDASPVPVPAAAWLFGSAILMSLRFRRKATVN